jgi:hypothetical protein
MRRRFIAVLFVLCLVTTFGLYAQNKKKRAVCEKPFCKATTFTMKPELQVNPMKICFSIDPGNWRDGVNVPAAFQAETCRQHSVNAVAHDYQLGCAFDGGIVWGNAGVNNVPGSATTPAPNCNW